MKTHRFKVFVNDLHDFFQYAVTNIVLSYLCALQRVAEKIAIFLFMSIY